MKKFRVSLVKAGNCRKLTEIRADRYEDNGAGSIIFYSINGGFWKDTEYISFSMRLDDPYVIEEIVDDLPFED